MAAVRIFHDNIRDNKFFVRTLILPSFGVSGISRSDQPEPSSGSTTISGRIAPTGLFSPCVSVLSANQGLGWWPVLSGLPAESWKFPHICYVTSMCLPRDMNISGPGVERHEVKGVMTRSHWDARVCPVTYTDNNVEERERRRGTEE